jgi:hypothetical protein
MRQIQRFVVEGQELQVDMDAAEGPENGMEIEREWEGEGGWEVRRFCEYRHTGHLEGPCFE